MSQRRLVAVVLAFVSWLLAAGALVVTASIRGLTCDESCGGDGWRETHDAWQWDAILALGLVVFVAATLFLLMVWKQRRLAAACAFVAGIAAAATATTMYSPGWVENLGNPNRLQNIVVGLVAVTAPVLAILLAESRGNIRSPAERP